jgi:hypothetical protein
MFFYGIGMKMKKYCRRLIPAAALYLVLFNAVNAFAWYDETHLAIAKAAGYKKWYNAAGADMTKIKAGKKEGLNHFVNNPPDTVVTPKMVMKQVKKYNTPDLSGHLYGAIIASLRDYISEDRKGKYAHYHLAFCAHYVGDLSQPLHNIVYDDYNDAFHQITDGIINDEILDHPEKIRLYPIVIKTEEDLANEIARIATLSIQKAGQLEKENRRISTQEAYAQVSHSASLFKAILEYADRVKSTTP